MAKAILSVTKQDLQEAAAPMHLCAGQIGRIENGVHYVQTLFKNKDAEAVLLVDASNAFNALNRHTGFLIIPTLSLALTIPLINTYRAPSDLSIDGKVLLSQKGQPKWILFPCQCTP